MSNDGVSERKRCAHWWLFSIFCAAALQLGFLFWLGNPQSPRPRPLNIRTIVRFAPDYPGRAFAPGQERLDDPTLFALVTPRGFSREAWLTVTPFPYEFTNHLEEAQGPGLLGNSSAGQEPEIERTNRWNEPSFLQPLPPQLSHIPVPIPVVVPACEVRAQGVLAERALLNGPRLLQPAEPILTNTIVRVAVDATGRTVSAALWSSCGVATADEQALRFARAASFAPLGVLADGPVTDELAFGNLVFEWARVRWEGSHGSLQASTQSGL